MQKEPVLAAMKELVLVAMEVPVLEGLEGLDLVAAGVGVGGAAAPLAARERGCGGSAPEASLLEWKSEIVVKHHMTA